MVAALPPYAPPAALYSTGYAFAEGVCLLWPGGHSEHRRFELALAAKRRARHCCGVWAHVASLAVPRCRRDEIRPFCIYRWLPNMPRGSEDQRRGGVREINADACGRIAKHTTGPIHFNGRP